MVFYTNTSFTFINSIWLDYYFNSFIRNNEFVAFNALGATNKNIYLPVINISVLLLFY